MDGCLPGVTPEPEKSPGGQGPVVYNTPSSQLRARITQALVAAQSVHAALLTPAVIWPGTLIHLCWGGR